MKNKRQMLSYEDAIRDPQVRALFDMAVEAVNSGTQKLNKNHPPSIVVDQHQLGGRAVLEYRIGVGAGAAATFDAATAWEFTERMRNLLGCEEICYVLSRWVQNRLRNSYFHNKGDAMTPRWVLRQDADSSAIPEAFYEYACQVALANLKHGPSHAAFTANEIFDWVTKHGSDLPERLKKQGSGVLPPELSGIRTAELTASANDALAVIRYTLKQDSEDAYRTVLEHLVRLLEDTEFPRSYAIEFRGPNKSYLSIRGLPRRGVNHLFANAVRYRGLHPLIEAYARAAMRENHWYENLEAEECAMPGSFAVFALGMSDATHAPLVLEYLDSVDGEHQSLQAKFVEAYVDEHGFSPEAVAYLVACAGNIQHLRHRKMYATLIAKPESLEALLALRERSANASGILTLRANLLGVPVEDHVWRAVLYTIWGKSVEFDGGAKILSSASQELCPLYQRVFA